MSIKNSWLYALVILHLFSLPSRANLTEQLPKVKEYLKNIKHPRLILGVANTHELNYFFKTGTPFIENPNDILANMEHDENALPGRTLSLDFNNLDQLKQVAESLPSAFDVITIDFSSIKFARWHAEHFKYFEMMLKAGGKILFPLDGDPIDTFIFRTDTKDEMFAKSANQIEQEKQERLALSVPVFAFLPKEEMTKLAPNPEDIAKIKALPLIFGEHLDSLDRTLEEDQAIVDYALANNIDFNTIMALTNPILKDDQKIIGFLNSKMESRVLEQLAEEFFEKHMAPKLTNKLLAIFQKGTVIIEKSLPMPAPHRKEYGGYSLSITKAN
jgi:hypothetical protein